MNINTLLGPEESAIYVQTWRLCSYPRQLGFSIRVSPLRALFIIKNGCNCFFWDVTRFWPSQQNTALAMIVGNFCRAHEKLMKEGKWTRATLKVEAYRWRDWRTGTVNSGQSPSHHLRCLPCTRINNDVWNQANNCRWASAFSKVPE